MWHSACYRNNIRNHGQLLWPTLWLEVGLTNHNDSSSRYRGNKDGVQTESFQSDGYSKPIRSYQRYSKAKVSKCHFFSWGLNKNCSISGTITGYDKSSHHFEKLDGTMNIWNRKFIMNWRRCRSLKWDTENWLTPAQVSNVSNSGLFGKGTTKMMTVWISGNSGFLITHRQTHTHIDTCKLYK